MVSNVEGRRGGEFIEQNVGEVISQLEFFGVFQCLSQTVILIKQVSRKMSLNIF